jgi:hypothetical protein
MNKPETIDNADLWAAIRGNHMWSADASELRALFLAHKDSDAFASRVICEAAWQVMLARHTAGNTKAALRAIGAL